MKKIIIIILLFVTSSLFAINRDVCYVKIDGIAGGGVSQVVGKIIFIKVENSNWSDIEKGNTPTAHNDTFNVVVIDIDDETLLGTVEDLYVNDINTPTSVTTTPYE